MSASLRTRLLTTLAGVAVLLLASTSLAFASVTQKTILTTTGLCSATPCGSAIYGAAGFSGTINYSADEVGTTVRLYDYMCVHTPGNGSFVSYGGTYTLTAGGTTSTYTVTGDVGCNGAANPANGYAQFVVPTGGVVNYSVSISGVTAQTCNGTFGGYNSILNAVFNHDVTSPGADSHVHSPSVAPCGPPANVPDAPFASLLLVTSGIGAAIFVARKNGFSFSRGLGR